MKLIYESVVLSIPLLNFLKNQPKGPLYGFGSFNNKAQRAGLNVSAFTEDTNTETTTVITSKITTENTHGGGGAIQTILFSHGMDESSRALSKTTRNEMAQTARALMQKLPQNWRNAGRYIDGLNDEQLPVLLTWLWLWQLTAAPTDGYNALDWQEYEDTQKYYGEPFAGLENIPGYIRLRVDENQVAELHETDLEALFEGVAVDN